jgi:DNA-binding GntR family transcriptional regulator
LNPSATKADQAYALVKGRLRDRTYPAGHRIVIAQLVRETGISGIPWREAFRRLEAEGWLVLERNVGARVASFDAVEYDRAARILALLGAYATVAAVPNLAAADIAAAREINARMAAIDPALEPERNAALDREFHFVFYLRAGDAHLSRLIVTEWDRLDVIRRTAAPRAARRHDDAVAEHSGLLDLLERGRSPEEIEECARSHFMQLLYDPVYETADA